MIYLIVLLVLIYGTFKFNPKTETQKATIWYIFEWAILVLLAGLRYKLGGDSIAYEDSFINYPDFAHFSWTDNNLDERYAILWRFYMSLCRSISDDFLIVQVTHAIITNTCFFYFFYKHCKNYIFAAFLYAVCFFFVYNTETLRATLSICVFLLSYDALVNRKWLKYVFCAIIAYSIHNQAIIMLVFPIMHLLKNLDVNKKHVVVGLFVAYAFVLVINAYPILEYITSLSSELSNYYSLYSYAENNRFNINAVIADSLIKAIPALLILILNLKNRDPRKFFCLLFILLNILATRYSAFTSRMVYFAVPILISYIADTRHIITPSKLPIYNTLLLIFVITTIYSLSYLIPFIYPYSSIIDKTEYIQRSEMFYELMSK